MLPKSLLEIDRASCVGLLLLPIVVAVVLLTWGRGRDGEVASVHHIIDVALAWHGILPPEPCLAVAMWGNCCAVVELLMEPCENLLIVDGNDALHIFHSPIAQLDLKKKSDQSEASIVVM